MKFVYRHHISLETLFFAILLLILTLVDLKGNSWLSNRFGREIFRNKMGSKTRFLVTRPPLDTKANLPMGFFLGFPWWRIFVSKMIVDNRISVWLVMFAINPIRSFDMSRSFYNGNMIQSIVSFGDVSIPWIPWFVAMVIVGWNASICTEYAANYKFINWFPIIDLFVQRSKLSFFFRWSSTHLVVLMLKFRCFWLSVASNGYSKDWPLSGGIWTSSMDRLSGLQKWQFMG